MNLKNLTPFQIAIIVVLAIIALILFLIWKGGEDARFNAEMERNERIDNWVHDTYSELGRRFR